MVVSEGFWTFESFEVWVEDVHCETFPYFLKAHEAAKDWRLTYLQTKKAGKARARISHLNVEQVSLCRCFWLVVEPVKRLLYLLLSKQVQD